MGKPILKKYDPLVLCQRQAEECARDLYRVAAAPTGSQLHDAKQLHQKAEQAWERFCHWGNRFELDSPESLVFAECWRPVMGLVVRCVMALEEHLKVYPDPEIQRFVRLYRSTLEELEKNQTEAGKVEVVLS